MTATIDVESLHRSVPDPVLDTMTFLNEITLRYPEAISFGPGRPYDALFDVAEIPRLLETYLEHLRRSGRTESEVRAAIFQYGETAGQIRELVADMLRLDEGIVAGPESIVVTVGCQEAILLVLRALFAGPEDVLLVDSPCYVGVTGAARLLEIPVVPVSLPDLDRAVRAVEASGRRARAVYVVPDCSNPSGATMPLPEREALLAAAERLDLLLIEDNPYGFFSGQRLPTLKSLDRSRRVIYLGSFAKTAFPGARVGYAVADQPVRGGGPGSSLLAAELTKVKSMITVNTPSLSQAVVGGLLLANGGGLRAANAAAARHYQTTMRRLRTALAREFPPEERDELGVSWNEPDGGFFLTLEVPFRADEEVLRRSAQEHGVIWTPMKYFHLDDRGDRQMRLACSYLSAEQVDAGVSRLATLIRRHPRK